MSASAIAFCSTCGSPFAPRRSTARVCSSRCRIINHRSPAAKMPPRPAGESAGAFLSVSGAHPLPVPLPKKRETLRGGSRGLEQLPPGIVRDKRYPEMYRVVLPDGSLSDMVNLARAKDALAAVGDGSAA
jgi:hypothetical protein